MKSEEISAMIRDLTSREREMLQRRFGVEVTDPPSVKLALALLTLYMEKLKRAAGEYVEPSDDDLPS